MAIFYAIIPLCFEQVVWPIPQIFINEKIQKEHTGIGEKVEEQV